MKQILIALVILLAAELSFSQSLYTERAIRWSSNTDIFLIFLKQAPKDGDTIVGLRFFELEEMENKIVGLIQHRIEAEKNMAAKDTTITALNTKLDAANLQLTNLTQQNKNVKKTWLKRGLGIGIGGVTVGLAVGLILPLILD